MNFTPLRQKLLRTVSRKHHGFLDVSSKHWTMHPAEDEIVRPAVWLDDDLDNVTGVMEDSSYEQEMTRIRGGSVHHAATVAYELSSCHILDGVLYKGAMRQPLSKARAPWISLGDEERFENAALSSSFYGSIYFGHWMTDDLTLRLVAQDSGLPVSVARQPYGHEPGYWELLGLQPRSVRRAKFDRLVVFEDYSQNSYKRQRYLELRSRIQSAIKPKNNRAVWIRRGTSGAPRSLTNSVEVENCLIKRGFTIIEPESMTVREIMEQISGAKLVVGIEGSQVIHGLPSMPPDGAMCMVQPPYRFNNVIKGYADCIGITYGFVTGKLQEGGFSLEPDRLNRILDRLEQQT